MWKFEGRAAQFVAGVDTYLTEKIRLYSVGRKATEDKVKLAF